MSSNPAVISVIGSLNVDLVTRTSRVPVGGETLTAESFDIGFGGKGANQAVACSRLSRTQRQAESGETTDVEVRMVGAVGDDEFADGFLKSLQKDGLKTDGVKVVKGKKTGVAVIIVETGTGENRIMLSPGANYEVPEADLVDDGAGVVLFQLEIPLKAVSKNSTPHFMLLYRAAIVLISPGTAQYESCTTKGSGDDHQPCTCDSSTRRSLSWIKPSHRE